MLDEGAEISEAEVGGEVLLEEVEAGVQLEMLDTLGEHSIEKAWKTRPRPRITQIEPWTRKITIRTAIPALQTQTAIPCIRRMRHRNSWGPKQKSKRYPSHRRISLCRYVKSRQSWMMKRMSVQTFLGQGGASLENGVDTSM